MAVFCCPSHAAPTYNSAQLSLQAQFLLRFSAPSSDHAISVDLRLHVPHGYRGQSALPRCSLRVRMEFAGLVTKLAILCIMIQLHNALCLPAGASTSYRGRHISCVCSSWHRAQRSQGRSIQPRWVPTLCWPCGNGIVV